MIQKVTITKAYRMDKDKEGKPLMSKAGKPYSKLSLKTEEYGPDVWVSGFGNSTNEKWTEGSVVEIIVEKKESNGKTFYNFDTPKTEDLLAARVAALELDIMKIKQAMFNSKSAPAPAPAPEPTPEPNIDDVPF